MWLIRGANEAEILIDDFKIRAIIDSDTHVSLITKGFCVDYGLKVRPMERCLNLVGTKGFLVLYLGYVKINVKIPHILQYNEDLVMSIIPASCYGDRFAV